MKAILILALGFALTSNVSAIDKNELRWARSLIEEGKQADYNYPKEGYVPDEQTAISIAVSVWMPIYGKENIQKQKPYVAILLDGYWIVSGSFPDGKPVPGGVAHAIIEKQTGKIVYVIHSL